MSTKCLGLPPQYTSFPSPTSFPATTFHDLLQLLLDWGSCSLDSLGSLLQGSESDPHAHQQSVADSGPEMDLSHTRSFSRNADRSVTECSATWFWKAWYFLRRAQPKAPLHDLPCHSSPHASGRMPELVSGCPVHDRKTYLMLL